MPAVRSSAIASVDYDPGTRRLSVRFHETGLYTYYGVPAPVYEAMLRASSVGRFFNDNIRDRYSAG